MEADRAFLHILGHFLHVLVHFQLFPPGRDHGVAGDLAEILIPAQLMLYGLCHENAVSTYGIIGGMALPLIMFPSAITNSLAVMLVPKISEDSSADHSDGLINTIS